MVVLLFSLYTDFEWPLDFVQPLQYLSEFSQTMYDDHEGHDTFYYVLFRAYRFPVDLSMYIIMSILMYKL